MFPVRNLGGMHPVYTRELVHCLVPFNGVQCDPSFELRAVTLPLCRHLLSPHPLNARTVTQHSILRTCPVFGVHYKPRLLRRVCKLPMQASCVAARRGYRRDLSETHAAL